MEPNKNYNLKLPFKVWIYLYINDRFTIPELVLPIANKRRVTHYPRFTKKEKQRRPTAATINQTNKGALTSLKGYIFMVSNWDSFLKLLQVVLIFHLYLYLFWWGFFLEVTLVSFSFSTSSIMPACSILVGYVHKFGLV